jgi:hypothetical protein
MRASRVRRYGVQLRGCTVPELIQEVLKLLNTVIIPATGRRGESKFPGSRLLATRTLIRPPY